MTSAFNPINPMGFGSSVSFGFGMHRIVPVMVILIFVIVFVGIFIVIVQGISQWNKNNHSPRLTVPATVIAKRTNVSHHRHGGANNHHHHSSSTSYYVTFQVESGDRMELHLSGQEYGLLIEGDRGNLTFQGTRYLGFERLSF